jgi:thiamine pyrophosphate-dependent acetolactate synthase large subunit-like protein
MNAEKNTPARNTKVMNRFDLTSRLVARLKHEEAVVGGIGNTNFDLWAAGHRPQNFYMLGSMGLAFPIALGVALAQPTRRVFALEGDGSLLMQMGCLSTIATLASTRSPARSRPRPRPCRIWWRSQPAVVFPTAFGPPTKRILNG